MKRLDVSSRCSKEWDIPSKARGVEGADELAMGLGVEQEDCHTPRGG